MKGITMCRRTGLVLVMALCAGTVLQGSLHDVWGLASSSEDMRTEPIIALKPVLQSGLKHPVFLTQAPDETAHLFVVEQPGRIRILEGGRLLESPFLDISDRVMYGGERGLLGLAFHPEYKKNGRLFVNYTRAADGATVIAEYRRSTKGTRSLSKERILLVIDQPFKNHNGGMIAFGRDGFLYIGMGDGGAGGDPGNRAQDRNTLLGKMIRLDVDPLKEYGIPRDNPFVSQAGRDEIFAIGLRNPWRFSFDSQTGLLWAGDVGQEQWEEIDIVRLGGNYGWRVLEGNQCFHPQKGCVQRGTDPPIAQYQNQGSRCSIIGGYVYRGKGVPRLTGRYLFGDFCSGEIFALPKDAEQEKEVLRDISKLLSSNLKISSFGQDRAGEIYVLDIAGGVYKIVQKTSS